MENGEQGHELVEQAVEYFQLERSDILYPLVILDGTCLSGYDRIRGELAECLEAENGTKVR